MGQGQFTTRGFTPTAAAPPSEMFQPRGFATESEADEGKEEELQKKSPAGPVDAPLVDIPLWAGDSSGGGPVQAKLSIGQPGDKYEQEADSTAAQVMKMPEAVVQPKAAATVEGASKNKKETLQPKSFLQAKGENAQAPEGFEQKLAQHKGKGKPLSDEARGFMEPRFGSDFSGVRVHEASQEASAIKAQAFTHGQDIYFNSGKYNPGSSSGKELLAHELTHVVQQSGGSVQSEPATPESSQVSRAEQDSAATPDSHGVRGLGDSLFVWRMVQSKLTLGAPAVEHSTQPVGAAAVQSSSGAAPAASNVVSESPQPLNVQAKCSECAKEEKIQREPISPLASSGDGTIQANPFGDVLDAGAGFAGDVWDAGTDLTGDVADWTGDRLEDLAEMGAAGFAKIVEQVSPDLADLIRSGPEGLITETLEGGIQDWLGGILGDLDIGNPVNGLIESVGGVFESVTEAIQSAASCESFEQWLNTLRGMAESFMESAVFESIESAFSTVSDVLTSVRDAILAPVFDALMDVAGEAFSQVKALASTIWEWGGKVREVLSKAWNWVLEKLGIRGDGEGGIWAWLKEKASAVWDTLKETFAPIIGPLKTIGGILVAISPAGPFLAAIKYGPQIVEAVKWLWNNKDNPDIVKAAHEEMGHTILPDLLSGAQGLGETLRSASQELIGQLVGLGEGFLELLGSISGIPILNIAQGLIQSVSNNLKGFLDWCQDGLQAGVDAVLGLVSKIKEIAEPYIEVLTSLALAVTNPALIPVLLAGWAWRALPDCYKPPIIDFLLDAVIGILRAMPEFPVFGPLWVVLKEGMLGFLEEVRSNDDDTKIAITNKLAVIISGGSPDFLLGFVKGFLRGLWEGIIDPFKLMFMAIEGYAKLLEWLNQTANSALGNDAEKSVSKPSESPASSEMGVSMPTQSSNAAQAAGSGPSSAGHETLGGGGTATETIPPEEREAVGKSMGSLASDLEPDTAEVTENFMPAAEEAFSGGEGITYEQLTEKLSDVWESVKNTINGAGKELANKVGEFLLDDSAEGKIGDGVGWLTGTIVLEVVVGILTVGTVTAAKGIMKVLVTFAKVLDWTGPALKGAFQAIGKLGGFAKEVLSGIGKFLTKAGGKTVNKVLDAIRAIGNKLLRFSDESLSRAGRETASETAETAAERTARETAETTAERTARETTTERTARETAETTAERTAREGSEQMPTSALTNDELAKAGVSLKIGDTAHKLKPVHKGKHIQLVICTTCGSLTKKIDTVLEKISSSGPTKSLHARLSKLKEHVAEVEKKIDSGDIPFNRIPNEANRIGSHLNDLARNHPQFGNVLNTSRLMAPSPEDYAQLAKKSGYQLVPGARSHGAAVYRKGNMYISPDVGSGSHRGGSHNGGIWKAASSVKNLQSKNRRLGTYDADMNKIGD